MKQLIYAAGSVVVALGLSFVLFGHQIQQKFGSYNPPVNSGSGFSQTISTSSVLAANSFCNPTSIQYLNSSALVTSTLPAATSTFASCPNLVNAGAYVLGKFVNDSTNTVAFAIGTGDVFKCETQAVGTSTVAAGGTCTASSFTLLASSTVDYAILFDPSSSSLIMDVGNNYK